MESSAYLTVPEAAKHLRVSPSWLYKRVAKGLAPALRIGGQVRFTAADLDEWVRSGKAGRVE